MLYGQHIELQVYQGDSQGILHSRTLRVHRIAHCVAGAIRRSNSGNRYGCLWCIDRKSHGYRVEYGDRCRDTAHEFLWGGIQHLSLDPGHIPAHGFLQGIQHIQAGKSCGRRNEHPRIQRRPEDRRAERGHHGNRRTSCSRHCNGTTRWSN